MKRKMFKDIRVGEEFFDSSGDIHMKLPLHKNEGLDRVFNAERLSDGEPLFIYPATHTLSQTRRN